MVHLGALGVAPFVFPAVSFVIGANYGWRRIAARSLFGGQRCSWRAGSAPRCGGLWRSNAQKGIRIMVLLVRGDLIVGVVGHRGSFFFAPSVHIIGLRMSKRCGNF